MKFTELPLSKALIDNLDENNFTECTEVQALSMPYLLDKKNVMVQAQTGTGKTAAFVIPLLEKLSKEEPKKLPTGLIISPTRELASQIMEDAEILGAEALNIPGALLFGGANIMTQQKALNTARFIVATPGRLMDFCSQNKSLLSSIDYFVLDEADRLFDMGFYPEIKKVIALLQAPQERQSMLFSATLSNKVKNMAKQDFDNPIALEVPSTTLAVDKIMQEAIFLEHKEKLSVTLGLLQKLDSSQMAVVFVNTKHNCEAIALRLMYNGINCDYINGDLPQNRRQKVIKRIKDSSLNVLIATDVAARGLHIHNLALVINYDLPEDPQSYIHRIGRTGRAGKNGEAISLICDKLAYNLEGIEKLLKHRIPIMQQEYQELIAEDVSKDIPIRQLAKSANKVIRTEHKEPRGDSQRRGGSGGRNSHSSRNSNRSRNQSNSEYKSSNRKPRDNYQSKPTHPSRSRPRFDDEFETSAGEGRNSAKNYSPQNKSRKPSDNNKSNSFMSNQNFNKVLDKSMNKSNSDTSRRERQEPHTASSENASKKKLGLFGVFTRLIKKEDIVDTQSSSGNRAKQKDSTKQSYNRNKSEQSSRSRSSSDDRQRSSRGDSPNGKPYKKHSGGNSNSTQRNNNSTYDYDSRQRNKSSANSSRRKSSDGGADNSRNRDSESNAGTAKYNHTKFSSQSNNSASNRKSGGYRNKSN